jgi:hypothetical protein
LKLLIDNQLPEALAAFLVTNGISVILPELRAGLENGIPVIEVG